MRRAAARTREAKADVAGAALLPSRHVVTREDRELFERLVAAFVPPGAVDSHAHLYPLAGAGFGFERMALGEDDGDVGVAEYDRTMRAWMGDRCPTAALFFGIPSSASVDTVASNRFVTREVAGRAGSAALWLTRPGDDPAATEAAVREAGAVGLKVYHTFVDRKDTANAVVDEYAPAWMWELADRHGLILMVHLVRPRALADEGNQRVLRERLRRYPGARLVLAHAGRGFCAQHTIEGVEGLAGFENVYFDTSAVCEPAALLAVLQAFGPSRLLYGSDYPVSVTRGRAVGVGDGFVWVTEGNVDWERSAHGKPTLVGIESLLALKQAARFARLTDADVEAVFIGNARGLLGR